LKRKDVGVSTVISTIILSSVLLVIIGIASYAANNTVNAQIENAEFEQAGNVLLSTAQVVKRVMFTPRSSGYVRSSFSNTIPQFVKTGENLTISIVDGDKNWSYYFPVNIIRIKGGRQVGVLTPQDLLGEGSLLLTESSGSLGRVRVFQSDGACVSLDYLRVRSIYAGVSDYFNGTGYEGFNVVEITLVNLTFGVFEPGTQALITIQNLGVTAIPTIQASKNFIINVSLTSGETPANCTLSDLGGDPQKQVLINLNFVNIEVSMLKGG